MNGIRKFLTNFWVCLMLALFLSFQTVAHYTAGDTGWAVMLGFFALLWLNDARLALNRGKEASDGQGRGTPER